MVSNDLDVKHLKSPDLEPTNGLDLGQPVLIFATR